MKNIVILISGTGTNMLAVIKAAKERRINARICAVISSNHEAQGLIKAQNEGIKTFVCPLGEFENSAERDAAIKRIIDSFSADFIVLAGYLGILTDILIDSYPKMIVNIHPSLLPKYGGKGCYGINVHQKVIENGDKISGATVHFVDKNIDTGDIIAQRQIEVFKGETPQSLQKRILTEIEPFLLVEVLEKICKK